MPRKLKWTQPKIGQGCAIPAIEFLAGCNPLLHSLKDLVYETSLKDLKRMLKSIWFLQWVHKTPASPFELFQMELGSYLIGMTLNQNGVQFGHCIGYCAFKCVLYPGFGPLIKIEECQWRDNNKSTRKGANRVFSKLGLEGI